jgi:L-2,4-diaminobutyrate decarboxylase
VKKTDHNLIYSGASPEQVAEDLKPLVDFKDEGLPLDELRGLIDERLLPHLMRYDDPGFQSLFNAFPEPGAKLGALVALEWNQGVTNWQVSPGGSVLEEQCMEALCRLFELDPGSGGTCMRTSRPSTRPFTGAPKSGVSTSPKRAFSVSKIRPH